MPIHASGGASPARPVATTTGGSLFSEAHDRDPDGPRFLGIRRWARGALCVGLTLLIGVLACDSEDLARQREREREKAQQAAAEEARRAADTARQAAEHESLTWQRTTAVTVIVAIVLLFAGTALGARARKDAQGPSPASNPEPARPEPPPDPD